MTVDDNEIDHKIDSVEIYIKIYISKFILPLRIACLYVIYDEIYATR